MVGILISETLQSWTRFIHDLLSGLVMILVNGWKKGEFLKHTVIPG